MQMTGGFSVVTSQCSQITNLLFANNKHIKSDWFWPKTSLISDLKYDTLFIISQLSSEIELKLIWMPKDLSISELIFLLHSESCN